MKKCKDCDFPLGCFDCDKEDVVWRIQRIDYNTLEWLTIPRDFASYEDAKRHLHSVVDKRSYYDHVGMALSLDCFRIEKVTVPRNMVKECVDCAQPAVYAILNENLTEIPLCLKCFGEFSTTFGRQFCFTSTNVDYIGPWLEV